jgi:thioredoxin 1
VRPPSPLSGVLVLPLLIGAVYADWCGPCKAIAPVYEALSKKHSKPNKVTFTKVNVDQHQDIARQYRVTG